MSTDGSGDQPLTRAQLRALRAAEAAEAEAAESVAAPASDSSADAEPDDAELADAEEPTAQTDAAEPDGIPSAAAPSASRPSVPLPTTPIAVGLPDATPAQEEPAPSPAPPATTDRRFTLTLLSVLGALALVVGVLGFVSVTQGPRISQVQVHPAQAIETSGSRVILTANQRLDPIDIDQVTVEPAVPFTIDAAGRSVGIRFTVPLHDSTKYTVTVAGVTASGGNSADLQTSFTTPASTILLLQRTEDGDDTIFASDLGGENARPVFAHPRIDDFRATPDALVVSVEEDDGSHLLVMNRDGSNERELKLPGPGYVTSAQVSDRGGLVGYSYSDLELTEDSGRASVLVTQSLSGKGDPRIVQVAGAEASVGEWQFVPDSSSLLFIDFDGALSVEDPTTDAGPQPMGTAASILGVNRGTYTTIVERTDGSFMVLDLTDGSEVPLPESDPDYGDAVGIEAYPGGTLRHIVQRDENGMPTGQAVVQVDDEGKATIIREVSGADSILQTCASPSGQYVAVTIAPDLLNNPYDDLPLPLPTTLHTQLIDLVGDETLPTLSGFDTSWCRAAPTP